ncbi:MAG: dimethylhistidine N-methyltransferase [Myxococcota bacterium]|jgi:dimethylhistidine N-methyltransferase
MMESSTAKCTVSHHPAAPAPADEPDAFLEEVLAGLGATPKWLSPKWLYDERGSELFDQITEAEAYYPTRIETGIMQTSVDEMADVAGPGSVLIEYGSGSSAKTRILLERMTELSAYVPIDISEDYLLKTAEGLRGDFPGLQVVPVVADYTQPIQIPEGVDPTAHRVVYFPGSTIGNFHPSEAQRFLRRVAQVCGDWGGLLIGVDLKKDPNILHEAYNDPQGVTAAFNRNLLERMNRELGADFDEDAFVHYAFFDPQEGRVEMHLVSLTDQTVSVRGQEFAFREGETLWTESSYKYALWQFYDLAATAGFEQRQTWTDAGRRFAVIYLEAKTR